MVILLLWALAWGAVTVDTVPQISKQIELSWGKTHSYSVKFKQTVNSKRLGTTDTTTGTLSVKKPGKLRWEGSDGVTQIINGKKVIVFKRNQRRKSRVVDLYENGVAQVDMKALSFLSEGGEFVKNYNVLLLESNPKRARLKLDSKVPDSEGYIAEIDKSGYFLAALNIESPEARVRIDFSDRVVNPGLVDSLFEYVPEPNDVVHKQ